MGRVQQQQLFIVYWGLVGLSKPIIEKKSERAGPNPIGQNGQLVKRSLGPKSQVPDRQSQIPGPESRKNSTKKIEG